MLNDFWKQLKSGTDIRGVAVDGAGYEVNLTDETVKAVANGFVKWLSGKTGKNPDELKISIGRDSRISGAHIVGLSIDEMLNAGVSVIDCGLASTPSMFMTTIDLECDGAVQITASHHPYYRNGFKFFTREGGLEGENIVSILEYAQEGKRFSESDNGKLTDCDYMSQYAFNLREMIKEAVNSEDDYNHPLKGFRIVTDAGNGVGGFYASDVLEALGADIRGSRFLNPDGTFPNHVPNPEDPAAMESICDAVKKSNADLGVIFDTDVDRAAVVYASGKEINRSRLVALASAIALENNAGGLIVTDSITSSGLKDFIENDLGGKHLRFKRGYKNVIDEAIKQNRNGVNCPLAIETSGHAAMRENYFLDDGAYLVTKIIIKMAQLRKEGKKLQDLTAGLNEAVESKEIRIKINEKDFRTYGEKVISDLYAYAEKQKTFKIADDNHEGIRVSFDKRNGNGWFLLRLSVHDPIMPLNIESDSEGGTDTIYKKLKPFLESCEGLDTYKPTAKKSTSKPSAKLTATKSTATKSTAKKTTKTEAAKAPASAAKTAAKGTTEKKSKNDEKAVTAADEAKTQETVKTEKAPSKKPVKKTESK